MSIICRVMAEDYSQRSSGVPDLLVWNVRAGKAKFVEVKGPGDTLMETQKVDSFLVPLLHTLILTVVIAGLD